MTRETNSSADEERALALASVMRHIARRDHSRHELQTKLCRRFPPETVEEVLAEAERRGWLKPDDEIAARAALTLHRRLKGRGYIEGQLRKRRLPVPSTDATLEKEKARTLLHRKFGAATLQSQADRARAARYLSYRGFDPRTIRQVLNEEP